VSRKCKNCVGQEIKFVFAIYSSVHNENGLSQKEIYIVSSGYTITINDEMNVI